MAIRSANPAPEVPAATASERPDDTATALHGNAKRSVSLRMNSSDYGRFKAVAHRLRARESEVFRFALKVALDRLAALHDAGARGRALVPLLAELGPLLVDHFRLDGRRLAHIVNDGTDEPAQRVDLDDIELIALSNAPERYLALRLKELSGLDVAPGRALDALRHYLLRKYLGASAAPTGLDDAR